MQTLPILYSFRRCPFAIRARLALKISGQVCELREVVLRDKPESMLEVSSKGTVPVLIDIDGSVLDESLDIMLWTLRQKDPAGWLESKTGSVNDMVKLISLNDGEFKYHLDRYKYSNRYENVNAELHRDRAAHILTMLNTTLRETSYLFGPQPTIADIAIFPFIRQFANTDRSWFDKQDWLELQNWLNCFLESDLYLGVMKKYRQWRPDHPSEYFPEHLQTN
ncbi:glutathione S-transferase [Pseudomonadota bacterium]